MEPMDIPDELNSVKGSKQDKLGLVIVADSFNVRFQCFDDMFSILCYKKEWVNKTNYAR